MRRAAAALGFLSLLLLAGCTSPFTPVTTSALPEVRARFEVAAYDSDDDAQTDGVALTLRTAQPPPPLVGSDALIERNGDTNVTVWRCPEREEVRCAGPGNRGVLSWDVGETIYIRGLPGANRLHIVVRERFAYNTTVRVDETRDTEVWAAITVRPYDSDGNRTSDGLEVNLVNSDKAPFPAGEVKVLVNRVEQPVFSDARRLVEFNGQLNRGGKVFVDGYQGQNRVEVFLKATRFDLGTYVLGE